jgi:hypothetical protein
MGTNSIDRALILASHRRHDSAAVSTSRLRNVSFADKETSRERSGESTHVGLGQEDRRRF